MSTRFRRPPVRSTRDRAGAIGFVRLARSLALLAAFVPAGLAHAQTSVETFVMNVAGVVNSTIPGCTTGAAPPPVAAIFGANGNFQPNAGIAPCGLGGGTRSQTAFTGPLSDAAALPLWAWSTNSYTGDAAATAVHGVLEAESHSTLVGFGNYSGSEGMSVFRDRLTITSPSTANGTNGTIRFWSTISGALSVASGPGTSDVELWYRVNGVGSIQMRAQATSPLALPFVAACCDTVDGFALVNGSMSGSDELGSQAIPFVFGTPFDFRLALLAYTTPGNTATAHADFTAQLTRIEVRDAASQLVAGFQVAAESGAHYGPNGVVPAVPALGPAVAGLLASALGALGVRRLRGPTVSGPGRTSGG